MSHFIDRLNFFRKSREPFANEHGDLRSESRQWEDSYRARWQHDKVVRSTHGVNCTGSCSWKRVKMAAWHRVANCEPVILMLP